MKVRLLFILLLMGLMLSCRNEQLNPVPSFPVYMDLNIEAEFPHFVVDNGFQTMTFLKRRFEAEYIGYSGVLVIVGMDGAYHACDLCCPYCQVRERPVEIDGIYAVCPNCGEAYDLSYGLAVPTKGISRHELRRYKCLYSGGHLIIRN